MRAMIMLIIAMAACSAFAGGVGNGGDSCENRFETVRDDIRTWVLNGGSTALNLPQELTVDKYNASMLRSIGAGKISCTDNQIYIGTAEKTCKNDVDNQGVSQIECNRTRFLQTSENDQYVLVHHEYAGLAGIEVNDGEESRYSISNQISEYLEEQTIKKLVVKPAPDAPPNPKVFGEWEYDSDSPDQLSSNIWHDVQRFSIQPNKLVVSLTCHYGRGHGTATVALPIQITPTEIIPQYPTYQQVTVHNGGEDVGCVVKVPTDPIKYKYDAAGDHLINGVPLKRIHDSQLAKYPLSPVWPYGF